jgi:SecD/SecF fusion protein
MPTAYTGRVLLILSVLYLALCTIYPRAPFSIFLPLTDQSATFESNLRPGIDMVGGTSLLYEIEVPDDYEGTPGESLSQQVSSALKRRVDPQGVLNLVWRPQGDTRLEIQLPLSQDVGVGEAAREEYQEAQERLAAFDVTQRQVVFAVENFEGDERDERLLELAGGGEARLAVFREVADAYDDLQAATGVLSANRAEEAYEAAKAEVADTNIRVEEVEPVASLVGEDRDRRLAELEEKNAGFDERWEAVVAYVDAATEFEAIRETIADTATLKRLLQGSGVLQFNILPFVATDTGFRYDDGLDEEQYDELADELRRLGPRPRAGSDFRWFELEENANVGVPTEVGPDGKTYVLAWNTDEKSLDSRDPEWGLERAGRGNDQQGGRAINFSLDPSGASLFGDLSGTNIDRPLAIVLDNKVISAPNLNSRITSQGIITGGRGGFQPAEQDYLVNTLNAGALPARLSEEPISERTVGPQLGADNIRAGFVACIAGLFIVGIFLIGYYYLSGVVAFVAVLMNMLIILASMAALQAPFTLPSVAGIILSLGMSVDANVLIFERLREEQRRGLSVKMALRNGYDRALSAILDSNITTGITALILYVFGSEEVKGFGLTLLIGIFASLFTALFVTKTIFGLMTEKLEIKDLSSIPRTFPKWDRLLTPKIDWMSKAWIAGGVSGLIILIGCLLFGYYFEKGRVLDTEFAGGTTAVFTLNEPMDVGVVRSALERDDVDDDLASLQVVSIEPSVGQEDDTKYEVVTINQDDEAVTRAILDRLGDAIAVRQPSTFDQSTATFDEVMETIVVPAEVGSPQLRDVPASEDLIAANSGGVAIILNNLDPMPEAAELEDRLRQQRLKGGYAGSGLSGGVSVDVETFPELDSALVLISNDRFVYSDDPDIAREWRTQLADPAWQMTVDAVANPEELEKVTKIGAQVAGEFQRDATLAVILSVLAIMAYIWIRFGDLKYSTATVVALTHDTLFCIAAIGFAHLLASTFIGDLLMLDPFRLNLTMVAAILTVMGFSMNDTVVVFDRIRENRGKYGSLTRKVVNDSINQTLSRTLLTGGTTLVTIFVMYVFGGPGIHGFTFAMLIGIITGTFSSIAIASPILLVGRREQQDSTLPAPSVAT